MKRATLSLIAIIVIASACSKTVDKPLVKKNPTEVMRKRSAAPPKPY